MEHPTEVREVKICWPTPDPVCLVGSCVQCDGGTWQTVDRIKMYAARSEDNWKAFVAGREEQWSERRTR